GDGDCVPGWKCAHVLGQTGYICQCTPAGETCNGADDDCDGVVDNHGANVECQGKMPGAVCVNAQCGCKLTCGGQCVDPDTDASNCGGCGNACKAGATNTQPVCLNGQCATSCQSGYADCDVKPDNGCETA